MPRHCSAGGCKSRDNRETRSAGVTFHKLPKEAGRRSLWITNSHRADSWDPRTDFVYFCSKHFSPDSFELTGCSGIRRLKEEAFPTVFDPPAARSKRRGGAVRQQHRKPTSSGGPENSQPETGKSQTLVKASPSPSPSPPPSPSSSPSPSPPLPRLEGKSPGAHERPPASPQEPAEAEQPSQLRPSPPPDPRSISPSRYMRRLPPPPGFYLPKEHSYAQLCPLLWRRRYDQAIDCLERALRQLHAARRRENRLRSSVLRLRERRLKQTLLVARDGSKTRGGWTPGGGARRGKGGFNQESEVDAKCEDTGFEDRCVDVELEGGFLPEANSWSEERGHCFYCGRGPAQGVSQPGGDQDPTVHEDSLDNQSCVDTGTRQSPGEIQIIRLEGAPVETSPSNPPVLLQTQPLPQGVPAAAQHALQFLGSQPELLLSDPCVRVSEASGPEPLGDLQQQQRLFWIQDNTETQLILVPVPAEDALHGFLKVEGGAEDAQPVLVSELGGGAPSKPARQTREDVREKLKEHLEGFHLQLSTEFQN